jgi:hypothetical protein
MKTNMRNTLLGCLLLGTASIATAQQHGYPGSSAAVTSERSGFSTCCNHCWQRFRVHGIHTLILMEIFIPGKISRTRNSNQKK